MTVTQPLPTNPPVKQTTLLCSSASLQLTEPQFLLFVSSKTSPCCPSEELAVKFCSAGATRALIVHCPIKTDEVVKVEVLGCVDPEVKCDKIGEVDICKDAIDLWDKNEMHACFAVLT